MTKSRIDDEVLVTQIIDVLSDNNKTATQPAIETIVNKYNEVKFPLINMLSKHPDWDPETYTISGTIHITGDVDCCITKLNALMGSICLAMNSTSDKLDNQNDIVMEMCHAKKLLSEAIRKGKVNVDKELKNSYDGKYIKLRQGQKISRLLSAWVRDYISDTASPEHGQKARTLLDQCISALPTRTVRRIILSLHPCDYLLMSNGNSWSSCHRLNDGDYESGTLSYMLDGVSMVCYLLPESSNNSTQPIWAIPKIARSMWYYASRKLIQSRLYPVSYDHSGQTLHNDMRHWVQSVIAAALDAPSSWILSRNMQRISGIAATGAYATAFPDYVTRGNGITLSRLKPVSEDTNIPGVVIIGAAPLCINCGNAHRLSSCLYCPACGGSDDDNDADDDYDDDDAYCTCSACGRDFDAGSCISVNSACHCPDCAFICVECHEGHLIAEQSAVCRRYGSLIGNVTVCIGCKEKLIAQGNLVKCRVCDVYTQDKLYQEGSFNEDDQTCICNVCGV